MTVTAEQFFTDGIPLAQDYPNYDNDVRTAASWYAAGDLDKAHKYVENIAERLHNFAGKGTRRTFLLALVAHHVQNYPSAALESPRDREDGD